MGHPERLVESTVVLVCSAGLGLALGWLLVSVLVCAADVTRAARHGVTTSRADGPFRPWIARVLVSTVLGTLVAATSAAATADRSETPVLPQRLEGLRLPDRAYGGVRTHEVRPGDSLWSVTAGWLPPTADDDAVARTWPRLHRLNRDRVGLDPHLVHPGTILRLPAGAPVRTRGATR